MARIIAARAAAAVAVTNLRASCTLARKTETKNEYLVVHKARRWLDKRSGVFCFIKMHKIAASPPIIRRQTIILKNEFRPTFI